MEHLQVIFPTGVRKKELLKSLVSYELKLLDTPYEQYAHPAFKSVDFYESHIVVAGCYMTYLPPTPPEISFEEEEMNSFYEEEFEDFMPFNEEEELSPVDFMHGLSRNHISSLLCMFENESQLYKISVCENGFQRHAFYFFEEREFNFFGQMLQMWLWDFENFKKHYIK